MKNVVFITIDALRYDMLKEILPCLKNIKKLCEESSFFENCFTNGAWTGTSFLSIFTGKLPSHFQSLKVTKIHSFTEILRRNGIKTAGFHTNAWLSRFFGYDKLFDVFYDGLNPTKSGFYKFKRFMKNILKNKPKLSRLFEFLFAVWKSLKNRDQNNSIILTQKSIDFIKNNNNFFLWIHYLDVHEPTIDINERIMFKRLKQFLLNYKAMYHKEKLTKQDLDYLKSLYKTSLINIDHEIGKIIDALKQTKKYDETAIIITSDHGQEFMEHGDFGHNGSVYEEIIHIPLIIKTGKRENKKELLDLKELFHTIPHLLGLKTKKNMLTMKGKGWIISEGYINQIHTPENPIIKKENLKIAIRTNKMKYIKNRDKEELYNLEKDPMEKENIISKKASLGFKKILEGVYGKT